MGATVPPRPILLVLPPLPHHSCRRERETFRFPRTKKMTALPLRVLVVSERQGERERGGRGVHRVAGQELAPNPATQYTVWFEGTQEIREVHMSVLNMANSVQIIQGEGSDQQLPDPLPMSSCSIRATALLGDSDFRQRY